MDFLSPPPAASPPFYHPRPPFASTPAPGGPPANSPPRRRRSPGPHPSRLVPANRVGAPASGERIPVTRRRQGLKAQMREKSGSAPVPGVGDEEGPVTVVQG